MEWKKGAPNRVRPDTHGQAQSSSRRSFRNRFENAILGLDSSPKCSRNCTTMNSLTSLTPKALRRAADLQEKIVSLQKELSYILGAPADAAPSAGPKKRTMSAAGRARIAAAARARWAKIRRGAKPARKPRRKMSPAVRARLAALAKARWKAVKAQGKTSL
jgi:hypothetical protein